MGVKDKVKTAVDGSGTVGRLLVIKKKESCVIWDTGIGCYRTCSGNPVKYKYSRRVRGTFPGNFKRRE